MNTKRSLFCVIFGIAAVMVALGIFFVAKVIPGFGKKTEESNGKNSRPIVGAEVTNKEADPDKLSDGNKDDSSHGDVSIDSKEITKITFAVPNVSEIDENYLRLFNQELLKDGHPYQLEIQYVEYDTYVTDLEPLLKEGKVDISFMGVGDGSNNIVRLLKSGAVVNLDEILTTDAGKTLYDAFPKALWEAGKCDGHIYSIPNATWSDFGLYVAFNKDYISDEAIEKWDGTIEGIYEIIKGVNWDDASAPRFQYLVSDYDFDALIGCDIRNGILYDYDTMQIENPLESEKLIGYLRMLEKMKNEGFIGKDVSFYQNTAYADYEDALKAGNCLVVLSFVSPDGDGLGGNFELKEIPPIIEPRINGSIGIANNPDKIDACIEFLSLLYGQEKYGNLLIYGRLGEDYKLENGYAVNLDGSDKSCAPWRETWMNLFIHLYPARGEQFAENRKESIFSFYDHAEISPFIGFMPDCNNENIISDDMDAFLKALNKNTLDEAVSTYSEKLKSDGIDECLNTLRSQWESYQEESKV